MWVTIPYTEDKITYSYEPHNMKKLYKGIPQLVCVHCGIVALKNDFTRFCISKGCQNRYHPDYNKMRNLLT